MRHQESRDTNLGLPVVHNCTSLLPKKISWVGLMIQIRASDLPDQQQMPWTWTELFILWRSIMSLSTVFEWSYWDYWLDGSWKDSFIISFLGIKFYQILKVNNLYIKFSVEVNSMLPRSFEIFLMKLFFAFQIMIRSIFLYLDRTYVLQNSSILSLWYVIIYVDIC